MSRVTCGPCVGLIAEAPERWYGNELSHHGLRLAQAVTDEPRADVHERLTAWPQGSQRRRDGVLTRRGSPLGKPPAIARSRRRAALAVLAESVRLQVPGPVTSRSRAALQLHRDGKPRPAICARG